MFKKVTKKVLLGLLMFAMVITTVAFAPGDAQAATKKAKTATVNGYYTSGYYYLNGQKGALKKWPEKLKVNDIIANRNKKAKYTFYAANKKKLTISTSGKITAVKNCKDGEIVKVIVKETYKKKTRKVGTMKFTVIQPKIMQKKVTWYVGQEYNPSCEEWSKKVNDETAPAFLPGAYAWTWNSEPLTQEDVTKFVKIMNGEIKDDSDSGNEDEKLLKWNEQYSTFKVQKEGTAYFALLAYDYSTKKYYSIGQFEANLVRCSTVSDLSASLDYDYDLSETPYVVVGEDAWVYTSYAPYYFDSSLLSVTSSDPSVATIVYSAEEDGYYLHGVKSGTVTITVDANGKKATVDCKVVTPEEEQKMKDDYWNDDYDDDYDYDDEDWE